MPESKLSTLFLGDICQQQVGVDYLVRASRLRRLTASDSLYFVDDSLGPFLEAAFLYQIIQRGLEVHYPKSAAC